MEDDEADHMTHSHSMLRPKGNTIASYLEKPCRVKDSESEKSERSPSDSTHRKDLELASVRLMGAP